MIGDRDRGLRRLVAGMTRRPKSFPGTIAMRCIERSAAADELTTRLLDRPGDDGPKAAAMLALGMHLIGRLDEAVAVAERVYADGRASRSEIAYNAACSSARAGSSDRAMRWLDAAVANGFEDVELLAKDDDLETLRGFPAFEALRTSLLSLPRHS